MTTLGRNERWRRACDWLSAGGDWAILLGLAMVAYVLFVLGAYWGWF